MTQYQKLPQLTFVKALKLACSRLFTFKGRSRRSEFWWFSVTLFIFSMILSLFTSRLLPLTAAEVVSLAVSFLAVPVLGRRLQDRGVCGYVALLPWLLNAAQTFYLLRQGYVEQLQSVNGADKALVKLMEDSIYLGLNGVALLLGIVFLVLVCLDSKPEPNRYGPSPKYVEPETVSTEEVFEKY